MKYNPAILRQTGPNRWKACFRCKEDGGWKETTRSIEASSKRYGIKGKRYFNSLAKYCIADVGLRNAHLNYRQLDEGHLIENVVFNELSMRGMSVGVGMVEARDRDGGKSARRQLEIDFVSKDGNARYYIQVARDLRLGETPLGKSR